MLGILGPLVLAATRRAVQERALMAWDTDPSKALSRISMDGTPLPLPRPLPRDPGLSHCEKLLFGEGQERERLNAHDGARQPDDTAASARSWLVGALLATGLCVEDASKDEADDSPSN